jgi:hypothetical protein
MLTISRASVGPPASFTKLRTSSLACLDPLAAVTPNSAA